LRVPRTALIVAVLLIARPAAAKDSPQDRLESLASAIQKGDARQSIDLFDPQAAGFAEIKRNLEALSALPDTNCTIAITRTTPNGESVQFETDWSLQIYTRQNGPLLDRKERVTVTLKRSGQIAVFVSRKDSKLYVRQNFSPLFDMPVTIAPDERPLGTHIFTAQLDKDDANVLHWSSVSLPAPARHAERRGRDESRSQRRNAASAGPIEPQQLPMSDSPAEALDRLSLPADVMARIYESLSTGGSIIVSDQGIAAGETGEGTDFIVSLR